MRFSRFTLVMLLTLALLLATTPTLAQDIDTLGLSEDDFNRLVEINEDTILETSYDYSVIFQLDILTADSGSTIFLDGSGQLDIMQQLLSFSALGSATLGEADATLTGDLRLVGNTLYITVLDPATGESTPWYSLSLDSDITSALGIESDPLADIAPNLAVLNPMDYLTASVSEADNGGMTFTWIIDGAALFTDAAAGGVLAFDAETMPEILPGLDGALVAGMLSEQFEIIIEQQTTADGALIERTTLDINGFAGDFDSVSLLLEARLNGYGVAVDVTPPPGDVVSLEEVLGIAAAEPSPERPSEDEIAAMEAEQGMEAETEAETEADADAPASPSGDAMAVAADAQTVEVTADLSQQFAFPSGATIDLPPDWTAAPGNGAILNNADFSIFSLAFDADTLRSVNYDPSTDLMTLLDSYYNNQGLTDPLDAAAVVQYVTPDGRPMIGVGYAGPVGDSYLVMVKFANGDAGLVEARKAAGELTPEEEDLIRQIGATFNAQ